MDNKMSYLHAVDRNISAYQYLRQSITKIEEVCAPLVKYFGITYFCYMKIYPNGEYFLLSNNYKWPKFYLENVHTESVIWDNEIHLSPLNKSNAPIPALWPKKPDSFITDQLINHNIWNGMHFTSFSPQYCEFWAFAGEAKNDNLNTLYTTKLDLLYKFIIHFNEQAKDYLIPRKEPLAMHRHGVDYPKYWPQHPNNAEVEFLQAINATNRWYSFRQQGHNRLSQQELRCLHHLSQGKTVKQVARGLNVSPRTIETHIEHIKLKTGYILRSDLIKFFQDNFF